MYKTRETDLVKDWYETRRSGVMCVGVGVWGPVEIKWKVQSLSHYKEVSLKNFKKS